MPDPIALNKNKKIIKKKLKPPKDPFYEKYPALAKIAAPVIYDTELTPNKYQGLTTTPLGPDGDYLPSGSNVPMPRMTADQQRKLGRRLGNVWDLSTSTGQGLYRGLGSVVGKVFSAPAWAYGKVAPRWMWQGGNPDLGKHLWQATEETYDKPLLKNVSDVADSAYSLLLDKNVNVRELVDLANQAKRQRERGGDYSYNVSDAFTSVADHIIQPDIQQKEYQRIANERGPAAAKDYKSRQVILDEVGGMYGMVRAFPHISKVPGISKVLSNKPIGNTLLGLGLAFDGSETAQREFFPEKTVLGEYQTKASLSALLKNWSIDTDAVYKTWDVGDGPALRFFTAQYHDDMYRAGSFGEVATNEAINNAKDSAAKLFVAGHESGDPTQTVVDFLNKTAKSNITVAAFNNDILPKARLLLGDTSAKPASKTPPTEAKPASGMLGKIQGSLSRYGQGAAQSLGYGEQFRKLSPTMQAAIPALLAASGLGLGAYGLYKLFGSGSGKEEEEKTTAYPALAKQAAELPYRERVELYARDPKDRIFSGLYSNDRTPGVPGGGVDEGEDPTESAAREFKEEVGHLVRDVQMLDVPTFEEAWKPPYMNKKQKERAKRYSGSRTRFATGVYDPAQKETPVEPWNSKYIMPRKPSTMLKGLNLSHDNPRTAARMAARKRAVEEVIRLLSEKTAAYPALTKVAYNPSVQSSASQFARSAAPPAASKPAGPPMSKLPAEQLAAKLSKLPVGAKVQTTVRDIKGPEYYDLARQKALDYRKANPELKFEQYLTPEAGNRKVTVQNTNLGAGMGGLVPHDDISLYHQTLEDVRTNGATAKITGPASLIQYNNKFTDDPQAGGDILAHEGTHVQQTPAEGETHITPASEVKWPLINKMMGTIPEGYHKRQRELEGFLSSAKRWNWQQTGQFPETPEQIDEAIKRYKASKGGRQFNYPWDKVRKPAPSLQFWNNRGLDPELRKRVHETWPGVVQNPMQNKTKRAAYPALTKSAVVGRLIGGGLGAAYGMARADKDNKSEYARHGTWRGGNIGGGSLVGGLLGLVATMALKNKYPSMPHRAIGLPAILAGGVGGGFAGNWLTDKFQGPAPWRVKKIKKKKEKTAEASPSALSVTAAAYPALAKQAFKMPRNAMNALIGSGVGAVGGGLLGYLKADKDEDSADDIFGHALVGAGAGAGLGYGASHLGKMMVGSRYFKDRRNEVLDAAVKDYADGVPQRVGNWAKKQFPALFGQVPQTQQLSPSVMPVENALKGYAADLPNRLFTNLKERWPEYLYSATRAIVGPPPSQSGMQKTNAYPALAKQADEEDETAPLSIRTKDLQTKIKRLVERYQVDRPWYHFGLGSEKVPGVDIVGQTMDEDYFKRRGEPRGLMVRTEGPDHFGLYPHTIDDAHGTMYEKESANVDMAALKKLTAEHWHKNNPGYVPTKTPAQLAKMQKLKNMTADAIAKPKGTAVATVAKKGSAYPALTKLAISITGLPIDVKPEDFEGISRAEVRRIKKDLPHPLIHALKTGLASAAVSGAGQSFLDSKITPRAGKWALFSGMGGGLIGGISQYMDNKRIADVLTQALKKQSAHGTLTKQSFNLNLFTQPTPEEKKEEKKKRISRPQLPLAGLLGAAGASAAGAGMYYGGNRMSDFANMKLSDLQKHVQSMRGGSFNKNPIDWLTKGFYNYNPKAVKDYNASRGPTYNTASGRKYRSTPPDFGDARLKDFKADYGPANAAVGRAITGKDLLESQLAYAQMGKNLLSQPVYGDVTGLQVMQGLRQPQNEFWFGKYIMPNAGRWEVDTQAPLNAEGFPSGEPYAPQWLEGAAGHHGPAHHYGEFSKGLVPAYTQLMRESFPSVDVEVRELAKARELTKQDVLTGRVKPEDYRSAFAKRYADHLAPAIHPASAARNDAIITDPDAKQTLLGSAMETLAGATGMPFNKQKTLASATKMVDFIENKLKHQQDQGLISPTGARLQGPELPREYLGYSMQPESLNNPGTSQPGIDNFAQAKAVPNQEQFIRTALNLAAGKQGTVAAMKKLTQDVKGFGAEAQKRGLKGNEYAGFIYDKLKDNPLAHLGSLGGPSMKIYYPVAAPFYRGMAGIMSAPGRAARWADNLSLPTKLVGGGVAAAGGAYGLYKLINYFKDKKKFSKQEEQDVALRIAARKRRKRKKERDRKKEIPYRKAASATLIAPNDEWRFAFKA